MIPLVMFILPVIVPGLHALPTGQKYKVVIPQQIHALYKSHTQDKYPHVVKYELQIEEEPLVIHLERNEELIADNYMETSYDQDDKPMMISPQENIQIYMRKKYNILKRESLLPSKMSLPKDHCYYQGHVENENQSMAIISTCSGISGLILTKGRRYLIEPQNLAEGVHVVYEEEEKPKACAVTDGHWEGSVLAQEALPTPNQEEIDHLLNVQKFLELVMVADVSMYHKYGNNTQSVKDKVFEMVNVMNADYKILNISVVLVGFEIWDTKNQIEVNATAWATLKKFSTWRKEKLLPRIAHDNAQLITNTDFEGPTVGLGNVGAMCSEESSAGIDQDHTSSTVSVASTIAHEVGHNLGMDHDDNNTCSCSTKSCIMSPRLSSPPPSKFSQCSMNQFKKYLLNLSFKCLMNKPQIGRSISPPFCGNNLIENGEQCDCGTEQECTNPCCDASTCKLKAGAVCADGGCCEKCQFKKAGSMCQHSLDECDFPDTCDGKSNRCLDLFKKDGTSCMNGQGYCLHGKCPTLKNQCTDLWGSDALVGADGCFALNFKGLKYGYCTQSGDNYLPCSRQDMKCGVLFCSGGNDSPNINAAVANAGACKAVLHQSGMVQNGTKCQEEKVCYKGACTIKEAVYESLDCNSECPGQVTCNQAGQCYCQEEQPNPKCAISGV